LYDLNMPKLTVRAAVAADALELADVVAEGFESYRAWAPRGWDPPDAAWQLVGIRDRLRETRCICLLALECGRVAGQVAYVPARDERGVAHLWMLFLREKWWGTGLAADLLGRAVTAAGKEGYTGMRLHTPAEHVRARAFYEREGWNASSGPFYEPMLGLTLVTYRLQL
jgi:GNAT superfamily N-acetyltransferase